MNKNIKWLGICLLLFFLSACGNSTEKQIAEQLELAQRYLAELNYEEAIIAFNKIIEIDEKNVDAYLGLGQIYEAQAQTALDEQNFASVEELLALSEEMYKKLQEINPNDERLMSLFAKIEELRNQVKEEKDAFEQEQKKEAILNSEIVQQIIQLCENGNFGAVYELMVSDEFQKMRDEEMSGDDLILEFGNGKGVGFYETDTYYGTMVYYGDYVDGIREGKGIWLSAAIIEGEPELSYYIAEGDWSGDKPNGYQRDEDGFLMRSGNVIDGVRDGASEETYMMEGFTYPVTFEKGHYKILYSLYDEGREDEVQYVIWDQRDSNGVVIDAIAISDENEIGVIAGYKPE